MAKKRGSRHKNSSPKAMAKAEPMPEEKQRYWEQKLLDIIDRPEKAQKAQGIMARLWPSGQDWAWPRRVAWFMVNVPARGLEELAALSEAERADEGFRKRLASCVLALDEATLAALGQEHLVDPAWYGEAVVVREASAAIARGRDDAGQEALRAIGLSSPFRETRMFLRGLSAFYARESDDATRALSAIRESSPLYPAAQNLRNRIEDGGDALDLDASLARLSDLVAQDKMNQALRALSSVARDLPGPALEGLARDLASVFVRQDVDHQAMTARIGKALGGALSKPALLRIDALAAETLGHHHCAAHIWSDYSETLSKSQTLERAEVEGRLGACFFAAGEIEADNEDPYNPGYYTPLTDKLYRSAIKHFEAAIQLDPHALEYWMALVEVHRELDEDKTADKTLEAMVKRFDQVPKVNLMAANAAVERGALDKALRYVRRALALEPLNRTARDVESQVLLAKARKEHKRRKPAKARKYYEEAREIPHLSPDQRLMAGAAQAAFDAIAEGGHGVGTLRVQALVDDPRLWLWHAFHLVELHRLGEDPVPMDPSAPKATKAEIVQISSLWDKMVDEFRYLPVPWVNFFEDGLGGVLDEIDDLDLIRTTLNKIGRPDIQYRLARRGLELAPDDLMFGIAALEAALVLQLSARHFEGYEDVIDRFLSRLREPTGDAYNARIRRLMKKKMVDLRDEIADHLDWLEQGGEDHEDDEGPSQREIPL